MNCLDSRVRAWPPWLELYHGWLSRKFPCNEDNYARYNVLSDFQIRVKPMDDDKECNLTFEYQSLTTCTSAAVPAGLSLVRVDHEPRYHVCVGIWGDRYLLVNHVDKEE
jgi:hypothetical protein